MLRREKTEYIDLLMNKDVRTEREVQSNEYSPLYNINISNVAPESLKLHGHLVDPWNYLTSKSKSPRPWSGL